MKKLLLSLAVAALALPAMAQTEDNPQEITVDFVHYSDQNGWGSIDAEVTYVSENTYTISNVGNSGASFTFTFGGELKNIGTADEPVMVFPITFNESDFTYLSGDNDWQLMNAEGNRATGWLLNDDTKNKVNFTDIRFKLADSYVQELEGDDAYYNYLASFGGWWWDPDKSDGANNWRYICMQFNFDRYEGEGAAVAGVEADENAPVEYYNLQGVKVANPENGIFVRRQGSKATKVIIK